MVGPLERDVERAVFAAMGPLAIILQGDLEGRLDGGRAIIRKEDMIEPSRGDIDQLSGEFDGGDVAESQQGGMGHAVELLPDGLIDRRHPVAMDVAPE